jgi:NADPH-dependent 2,4-dienoyl-CoA reductase/sulfur reductase-like enzyme
MFRTARNPIGRLAVILLLAPTIAGCSTTQRVPFNPGALKNATGVTTRSGWQIAFEEGGASFSADTVYARGRAGQLKVPAESIAVVWNRKSAPVKTVGLVMGSALIGAMIAGAAAFSGNFMSGSCGC